MDNLTEKTNIRNFNCYGFAIGKEYYNSPGGNERKEKYIGILGLKVDQMYYDAKDMAQAVIQDLGGKKNAQIVEGIDSEVPTGWYMIALRTTKEEEWNPGKVWIWGNDFHFMRQCGDVWKHKRGSGPIQTLPNGQTPESEGAWPAEYDSEIIYMIIREGWK